MGPQERILTLKRMDPTMRQVLDKMEKEIATGEIEKRANEPSEAVLVPSEPRIATIAFA